MARVNIVKRIKINGRWVMRSIPRKQSGNWDWNSLPDGRYYVEWYEQTDFSPLFLVAEVPLGVIGQTKEICKAVLVYLSRNKCSATDRSDHPWPRL